MQRICVLGTFNTTFNYRFFITKYPMKIQQHTHTHFQSVRNTSINQTQIWYGEFNQYAFKVENPPPLSNTTRIFLYSLIEFAKSESKVYIDLIYLIPHLSFMLGLPLSYFKLPWDLNKILFMRPQPSNRRRQTKNLYY